MLQHVMRIYLNVQFFRLGQHRHRRRRCMDAALRFGLRHTLYPMAAAFVTQHRPHALTLNIHNRFAKAPDFSRGQIQHLHLPASLLGILCIHVAQVTGKKSGLIAAGAGANLYDHRIDRRIVGHNQRILDLVDQGRLPGLQYLDLLFGQPPKIILDLRVRQHRLGIGDFARHLLVLAVLLNDQLELALFLRQRNKLCRIARDSRIDDLPVNLRVTIVQFIKLRQQTVLLL